MLYFKLRDLSRDNLSQLWILSKRDLEFLHLRYPKAHRYSEKSTAKLTSGRIAIYPNLKVFICDKRLQRDARSRFVRLQRGTAHIQRSTETRQVSVVMGRTWFSLLSALSMLTAKGTAATDTPRLASSRYRLARLRADRTLSVHTRW